MGLSAHPPATTATEAASLRPGLYAGSGGVSVPAVPASPLLRSQKHSCLLLAVLDVREGPSF